MSELLTNFKDDILAESMEGRRRYQMITNEDGTVSFVDVTEYAQVGSEFGQAEVNAIHREINNKFDSDDVVDPLVAAETGLAADAKLTGDAIREVSAKMVGVLLWENPSPNTAFSAQTISMDLSDYKRFVIQFGTINYSRLANFAIHKGGRYGCSYAFSSADVSGALLAERFVTTSDSGISFEDSIQTNPSTKPVNNNTRMIPRKIWGYTTD